VRAHAAALEAALDGLVAGGAHVGEAHNAALPYVVIGLPGVTVTVPAGGRVLLGYAGGNPDLPYACLWESGTVTSITINGGSARAAREGDHVTATTALSTWIITVSTLLNTPGVVSGAPGTVTPPGSTLGTIAEGSSALKLP
jgi:hypothetical protein